MNKRERLKAGEKDLQRKTHIIFPVTKRMLEQKLRVIGQKLDGMFAEGIPWQHDAGGFHRVIKLLS